MQENFSQRSGQYLVNAAILAGSMDERRFSSAKSILIAACSMTSDFAATLALEASDKLKRETHSKFMPNFFKFHSIIQEIHLLGANVIF